MKPYLPLEIITNILLRLSTQSIATCKCVCKPWLNLIESDAFVKSHLSKSAPALAVSITKWDSNWFSVFKLEDELEPFSNWFDIYAKHGPITKFDFRLESTIQCSANGLLLLKNACMDDHLYVCNPITREFVELRGLVTRKGDRFGFGVSKISGQHKVVCHSHESGIHVYTLKARSMWRVVEAAPPFSDYCDSSICGAFFSGNLHWLVKSKTGDIHICCFDLETERFNTFLAPPTNVTFTRGKLYGLGDCLCIHNDTLGNNLIWLLNEYEQLENFWTTIQLIGEEHCNHYDYRKCSQPIKIYRNGGILMLHDRCFFYYSKEKRNVIGIDLIGEIDGDCLYFSSILFTPSFLSPKRNLGMENAKSLSKKKLGIRM
ncbi:F-box protein At5g65850-like [Salvia splendens]|uniref:F-box protein At5g65850-like n=1 Tax=Salvia splendens TaxID=180675 RepID=UPI001C279A95|nr:F-box protein At5g65850-like [Salvia splendens]XP_042066404.1 F-box protein At5g65850-like [Salvia splendens]XP_042066405.1 F-box protein At5g65850-like [Salvia splendens]XP_042066406.1 F-box protein At5g65850-like [Salvia splendens]XP_042066407.1 F-box protein At5g65850-like [Salvia splendens]XP_042066408.1 F-box protein At5g65850-like [Salvia splendens]